MTLIITTLCIECHYADRQYAEGRDLLIAILNAVMLSVIMLSVIMLSVMAPFFPQENSRVIVNCFSGLSRSSCCVLAYLVRAYVLVYLVLTVATTCVYTFMMQVYN
jgi:hypothetical protein